MAITPVGSSAAAPTQAASLGLQDFLRILLTQLNYQDPLKPMDNQQFMAQMAQFTALEQAQQSNDKLGTLIANQAALQSVGLIGRTVDVQTESGQLTGTVASLALQGDAPLLTLTANDGSVISGIGLGQLLAVR